MLGSQRDLAALQTQAIRLGRPGRAPIPAVVLWPVYLRLRPRGLTIELRLTDPEHAPLRTALLAHDGQWELDAWTAYRDETFEGYVHWLWITTRWREIPGQPGRQVHRLVARNPDCRGGYEREKQLPGWARRAIARDEAAA